MQLSIVIVSYNSKSLVQNCLGSLQKAIQDIGAEIIIVDNCSTDGSKEELPEKYPGIKYIFNDENLGFAKACNQGFRISSGKYILFLNPDTILTETCLKECLDFFASHTDAGAVGVRMINGKGKFLKESKRGQPGPAASFYKLFGFAAIFPGSKTFSKYYQGHLPETENNTVEVLSGAFMMIKREVFEKLNGFDEGFFMYGEDIDISIRIGRSGYKNYYLGTISVTHIKGGSTTFNHHYIRHFYDAMDRFVDKHYHDKPVAYRMFLKTGIKIRRLFAMAALPFR